VNFPNPYPLDGDITWTDASGTKLTGEALTGGNAAIGTNLVDDHPVGFTNPGNVTDVGLVGDVGTFDPDHHFGGGNTPTQVECASCHNPHLHSTATDQEPFLRTTMQDSALCAVCHDK
jgi:hypothetical protein